MADYTGIAILISAATGALGGVTGAGVAIYGIIRQGRLDRRQQRLEDAGVDRDKTLAIIKTTVDGLGEQREAMAMRAGTAEGTAAGIAQERANPQSSV